MGIWAKILDGDIPNANTSEEQLCWSSSKASTPTSNGLDWSQWVFNKNQTKQARGVVYCRLKNKEPHKTFIQNNQSQSVFERQRHIVSAFNKFIVGSLCNPDNEGLTLFIS